MEWKTEIRLLLTGLAWPGPLQQGLEPADSPASSFSAAAARASRQSGLLSSSGQVRASFEQSGLLTISSSSIFRASRAVRPPHHHQQQQLDQQTGLPHHHQQQQVEPAEQSGLLTISSRQLEPANTAAAARASRAVQPPSSSAAAVGARAVRPPHHQQQQQLEPAEQSGLPLSASAAAARASQSGQQSSPASSPSAAAAARASRAVRPPHQQQQQLEPAEQTNLAASFYLDYQAAILRDTPPKDELTTPQHCPRRSSLSASADAPFTQVQTSRDRLDLGHPCFHSAYLQAVALRPDNTPPRLHDRTTTNDYLAATSGDPDIYDRARWQLTRGTEHSHKCGNATHKPPSVQRAEHQELVFTAGSHFLVVDEVADILEHVPEQEPYTRLKEAILKRTGRSDEELLRNFYPRHQGRQNTLTASTLHEEPTGETFHGRINLARTVDGQLANSADRIATKLDQGSVCVQRPDDTSAKETDLEKAVADLQHQLQDIRMLLSRTSRGPMPATGGWRRRARSTSRGRRVDPELCWYHHRFGTRAKNCSAPCKYSSKPSRKTKQPAGRSGRTSGKNIRSRLFYAPSRHNTTGISVTTCHGREYIEILNRYSDLIQPTRRYRSGKTPNTAPYKDQWTAYFFPPPRLPPHKLEYAQKETTKLRSCATLNQGRTDYTTALSRPRVDPLSASTDIQGSTGPRTSLVPFGLPPSCRLET
ncbi:unnamed protein product [Acanthosepion pharaonis]|uniref:Uncharacterized protein n=1 Tax=Acanthosepion pharaonis TaxID=158019 RepID=A0A812E1A4_ACAPH|nr:unnamed protein product [Sepia pharaonis]